jgi:hypothetical protein
MSKITGISALAALSIVLGATTAFAEKAMTHSPPSERTTQGSTIDPNFRSTQGGLIDPNIRKVQGGIIDPNDRKARGGH